MFELRGKTPPGWIDAVLADFTAFLQDHAANERKVSQAALQLAVHHHDLDELVAASIEVADEEFQHFRQVYALLRDAGATLGQDQPDPYMGALRRSIRTRHKDEYLLDRLVLFAIVEARGCERFALVAEHHPDAAMRAFYLDLVRSEARHHGLYLRFARKLFGAETTDRRLDELLDVEANVIEQLPVRAMLH